jgi:hypothetical protein
MIDGFRNDMKEKIKGKNDGQELKPLQWATSTRGYIIKYYDLIYKIRDWLDLQNILIDTLIT